MILSGRVEVLKRFGGEPRVVRTLGPGEYFGEMALLGRHPRSATTRALTPLDVLVLPGSDFSRSRQASRSSGAGSRRAHGCGPSRTRRSPRRTRRADQEPRVSPELGQPPFEEAGLGIRVNEL